MADDTANEVSSLSRILAPDLHDLAFRGWRVSEVRALRLAPGDARGEVAEVFEGAIGAGAGLVR